MRPAGWTSTANSYLPTSQSQKPLPMGLVMAPKSEILFIDPAVSNIETILAGLRAGVDAVLLESGRPAAQQMAGALACRRDLAAIHVIAHGAPGRVNFSAGRWSADTLASAADDLAAIGKALRPSGNLRLWSCYVGAGSEGASLVENLAQATGADVAAASGALGAKSRGGSWNLVSTNAAGAPVTEAAIADYDGVLSSITPSQETAYDIAFTSQGTGLIPGNVYYIVDTNGTVVTVLGSFVATSFTNNYSLTVSLSGGTTYHINDGSATPNPISFLYSAGPVVPT